MGEVRLLERVSQAIRVRQYSLATEKAYISRVRRFILFHSKRHPAEMGKDEVESFLTPLAISRSVSPSTQNQALQALLFLYRYLLKTELPWLDDLIRAIQLLPGHKDLQITMMYTHVVERGALGARSPLDNLVVQ